MVRGQHEGVLACVQLHAGVQGHDHQLAGGIPREGYPPGSGITETGTRSSFQRSTWCSKYTASPWAMFISATGTISPSTWQVLLPKCISVMSRRRGASRQPDSLTRFLMSSGAPQAQQL